MLTNEDIEALYKAEPDDTIILDDGHVVTSAEGMIELCGAMLVTCEKLDGVQEVDPEALADLRKCAQEMIDNIRGAKNYRSKTEGKFNKGNEE